jgi:hypothetical protein
VFAAGIFASGGRIKAFISHSTPEGINEATLAFCGRMLADIY